jgi:hypothetical protein
VRPTTHRSAARPVDIACSTHCRQLWRRAWCSPPSGSACRRRVPDSAVYRLRGRTWGSPRAGTACHRRAPRSTPCRLQLTSSSPPPGTAFPRHAPCSGACRQQQQTWCIHEGCLKAAQDSTEYCKAHGGGKRCQHEGCLTAAQGSTQYCIAHGGGRQLLQAARPAVRRTAGAGGANTRAAPSPRKAIRSTASRIAVAGAASTRAAPSRQKAMIGSTLILKWNVTDYMFASIESCVNKSPRSI